MFLRVAIILCTLGLHATAREPDVVLPLWPATPPDDTRVLAGPERDTSDEKSGKIMDRPLIRLGNVSKPEMHVFLPPEPVRNGTSVVICPGGGYNILAWDLEGTEVADWLNTLGVTGIVVKYRVPTSNLTPRHKLPVQDAQRAVSLTRARAAEWKLQAERTGILGFSAGGDTAARTAYDNAGRLYSAVDEADRLSCRPDFAVLVYTAYQVEKDGTVRSDLEISHGAPPAFLVHAYDDPIPVENALTLASRLKKAGVPAEIHLYDRGGHGYGLRPNPAAPVTSWPARGAEWMKARGLIP